MKKTLLITIAITCLMGAVLLLILGRDNTSTVNSGTKENSDSKTEVIEDTERGSFSIDESKVSKIILIDETDLSQIEITDQEEIQTYCNAMSDTYEVKWVPQSTGYTYSLIFEEENNLIVKFTFIGDTLVASSQIAETKTIDGTIYDKRAAAKSFADVYNRIQKQFGNN